MDNGDERRARAKERIEQLRGFYGHATSFATVNGGLLLLNLLTSPRDLWFFWPLCGWGIGLAAHAAGVFGPASRLGRAWEERTMRELLDEPQPRRAAEAPEATWPDLPA